MRGTVKQELFERDGWRERFGDQEVWVAECAFGCGRILTSFDATIDRYPVPGCKGGTYHIDNTRLACLECNNYDGRVHSRSRSIFWNLTHRQRRTLKKAQRLARKPVLTLEDVFGSDLYIPGNPYSPAKRPRSETA